MNRRAAAAVLLMTLLACGTAPPPTPPPAAARGGTGTGGAVSTNDPHATAAALDVLRDGGNAVDAAVAAALVLAVVFPEAGNLGGGGFAVVRMAGDTGELATLDFREVAPAAARPGLYLDAMGEPIPDASRIGPLAAGVPGSPAGLHALHQRFGRLPWKRLVAPARRFAEAGFAVDESLHKRLTDPESLRSLTRFPDTVRLWLPGPGGTAPPVGAVLRQPDLARTLAAYAEQGPAGVTGGPVAAAVEAAARAHGGILTAADLAAYRPVWREPLRFSAWGWDFATMPLPSAGGIVVGQTLSTLERLGWDRLPQGGAERAHLLAESLRSSYADRLLLGDPATSRATPADLLSPAWLAARAARIDRGRATPSSAVQPWPGAAPAREGDHTTHLSVIDGAGNLVALTTTLNDLFGGGFYVAGAGFFLNNEMDDFATAPSRPNLFGLVQGEANAVAPGKRPLSSMAPMLAWKGGAAAVAGGRGGSRIPTHLVQVLLGLLVDGAPLQEAVDRPRLHHQWLPDQLEAEAGALTAEARADLTRRGHTVVDPVRFAQIHAVSRRADGCLEAAADRRWAGLGAALQPAACPAPPGSPH